MDKRSKKVKKEKPYVVGIIHVLLSENYVIFFAAVILGVVFDAIFPIRIFHGKFHEYLGLILIIMGTIIIYWSQLTSRVTSKKQPVERNVNFFLKGPYRYTRNPTNFGLTLSIFGLGFLIDSIILMVFMFVAYMISKMFFMRRQDAILKERYGSIFEEYKEKVKDWL